MALSSIHYMGPTLSSALTACAPIFGAAYAILLLGYLVFRREVITWQTLATIALVVPGVILVVMN